MNVVIVVKGFPPDAIGGMETQTKRMATALHEQGHTVTVYTKSYGDHDDSDVDYEVVRVPNVSWSPFLSDLTFLVSSLLLPLRRSSEHDVFQCMMFYPVGFLGFVLRRLTGLPYFAWIRGGDYYLMRDVGWKRWMMRTVLDDALVLAQSTEIKRDVEGDFPDIECDIEVLGNGVTLPELNTTPEDIDVLYVGRLAPKKGFKYLLDAVAALDDPIEFTVVGDGDRRSAIEARSRQLDLDVQFVGWVSPDDVDAYYRRAKLLVLPSIEGEGLPNVVLEAMAHGLPIVATPSGGVPTLIEDGETGFIVPMRDPETLADQLAYLLTRPDERDRIGTNARAFVETNYSWDVVLDSQTNVYERVIFSS
jgi:glycosyltransferase involved in cell wall biosynthesis